MIPSALTLNHHDNLIILCPDCHCAYDIEYPYWVMVPTVNILNRYIRHEHQDYLHRVIAATQGQVLPRSLPDILKAEVTYHRFVLDTGWANVHPIRESVKTWAGEPTTAIFKALRGIAQPCEPGSVSGNAKVEIIESVRSKVMELVRVWSRPPPQVVEVPAATLDNGGGVTGVKQGEGRDAEGGGPPHRKRRALEDGSSVVTSKRVLRHRKVAPEERNALCNRILEWRDSVPAFGPQCS